MINEFLDKNLDKIKNEDVTVNIMSASWCAPCSALKVIMDKLSEEYKGRANFYRGDIEEGAINFASSIGVRSVPLTTIMKKGIEVDRLIGNPGEAKVKEFLDKNI